MEDAQGGGEKYMIPIKSQCYCGRNVYAGTKENQASVAAMESVTWFGSGCPGCAIIVATESVLIGPEHTFEEEIPLADSAARGLEAELLRAFRPVKEAFEKAWNVRIRDIERRLTEQDERISDGR